MPISFSGVFSPLPMSRSWNTERSERSIFRHAGIARVFTQPRSGTAAPSPVMSDGSTICTGRSQVHGSCASISGRSVESLELLQSTLSRLPRARKADDRRLHFTGAVAAGCRPGLDSARFPDGSWIRISCHGTEGTCKRPICVLQLFCWVPLLPSPPQRRTAGGRELIIA